MLSLTYANLWAAGRAPSPVLRPYHCRHYGAWHSTIGTSLAASISTHSTETMTLRVTPFLPKYLFDSTATTAAPSETLVNKFSCIPLRSVPDGPGRRVP